MLKIFKYLKSSFISVLVIIALLVVQAVLDLTLPDYTSKIVNVGVQQGGIENAAITQIGDESLNKLVLLLDDKDKNYILDNYEKDKKYKKETIYKLNKDADKEKVSNTLKKAMLIVYYIDNSGDKSTIKFDLPEGMDIYTALKYMDASQKAKMFEGMDKKLKDLPDTIIDQAAINYVKTEYKRIGVNTTKIQNDYIIKIGIIMLLISFVTMATGILTVYVLSLIHI